MKDPSRPARPAAAIAPARRVAWRILKQIAASDAHSDELLRSPEVDALSPADRNLTTTLVLGTLRWQLALEALIEPLLARPDTALKPEVATALLIGAYQLLHLDRVPAHAVLNDSVELVKQSPERAAAGMVNAILRRIAAMASTAKQTAVSAHPGWMVERWTKQFGSLTADAICRWDQEPASIALRLRKPDANLGDLETEPGALLACARRVVRGDVARVQAFRSGRVRIQDEASQLVAEIAAAAAPHARRALDTCAAPGGKTAILAERLSGCEITAVDVSRRRLDAMRILYPGLYLQAADAARLDLQPTYGLILCDVPCSGTGTLARNPEIRLHLDPAEFRRQHSRQIAILRAGLRGLLPEGRLVYSTCSLEPEEDEAVVEEILRTVPGLRIVPVQPILDRLAEQGILTPEGREMLRSESPWLRTIPGIHPCDGFFAAVIEKT